MPLCRACGTEIYFGRSPLGATMPFDAMALTPDEAASQPARVILYVLDDAEPPQSRSVGRGGDRPFEPVYISHFVTCSNPSEFSRGRR